ncbi:MAG: UDP-3-O-[3-hydroxymyristoyl] N-acetylglucosamine deacetylase [Phycisphaerales bacterium]|nr:UDP-3-O-[3-hydroxymyristoyl] N-acetylglucosamine deacetylase [Phycisphaerales bacterium]
MVTDHGAPGLARRQRTILRETEVSGEGLFSGKPVRVRIRPGQPGSGIIFRRVDLPDSPDIPAHVDHVVPRPRRTVLQVGGAAVETVEHCLSAFAGLGIDNAVVELDAAELPAGDGSASPFVEPLSGAGVAEQEEPVTPIMVTEPIMVRDGQAMVTVMPNDGDAMELMYVLDYGDRSPIPRQTCSWALGGDYRHQIAPARTFSTEHDARAMWDQGLFRHLTAKEMLVIGEAGPVDNCYRFDDEPVRHKLLDLLGDLSLAGRPISGRIVAVRSGHALNHQMARRLLEHEEQNRAAAKAVAPAMDIRSIMRLLPHRYPMILVDRVIEIEEDARAVGVKNVTINEPFFQGHYPGTPIMPGVLIVEAMCQLAGLMLSHKLERTGKIAVLLSLDGVKMRKAVTPGDQLILESEAIRASARFGDVQCRAFVAGDLVAEARVKFMMVDAEQQ